MMEEIRKAYYIQEIELAVLLAAAGQKQLYGYKLQAVDDVNEEQISQALFSMIRKEIIIPEENGLLITEEYRDLVQGIITAKRLFVAADREQQFPELYLYEADKIVAVQSYGQTGIMLKLEMWETEEAAERLMQCGFRMQSLLQGDTLYYEKEIEHKNECSLFYEWNKKKLLANAAIRFILLDMDIVRQKKNSQVLVLRDGVSDQIIMENPQEMMRYHYSVQKMKEILSKCVGGGQ